MEVALLSHQFVVVAPLLYSCGEILQSIEVCTMPISNCAKCLLLPVIIISSCPKHALVWGNCRERLRVEIFVRVLRSSEVISLILCK